MTLANQTHGQSRAFYNREFWLANVLLPCVARTLQNPVSEPHLSESSFIRTHKFGGEYHYMFVNLIMWLWISLMLFTIWIIYMLFSYQNFSLIQTNLQGLWPQGSDKRGYTVLQDNIAALEESHKTAMSKPIGYIVA